MARLSGKTVVVGISGGIAVYKVCQVVRNFVKAGATVHVVMTQHATEFVSPLTFETLSGNPVVTDMFARGGHWEVEHVSLAKKADLFVICPATANIVGKYAQGIADDMLSTTLMATTAPVVICPAMNVNMYHSDSFRTNAKLLAERGVHFVNADSGFLACGDVGEGRLAEPDVITDYCISLLSPKYDLCGKTLLVTCGATLEKLDDARFITNFSSGKMGAAIVERAISRGAKVKVVLARSQVAMDKAAEVFPVTTTAQMLDECLRLQPDCDGFIMAGAPCDYRPQTFSESKIKSDELTVKFVKNPDVAKAIGQVKGDRFLCVFSAETDNGVANATAKLHKKNADLAVLNDVKHNDVFGSDTNVVTFIDGSGAYPQPQMSKSQVADLILDRFSTFLAGKN